VFEHAPDAHFCRILRGEAASHAAARAAWADGPPAGAENRDFVVPFSERGVASGRPLFRTDRGVARAELDVLATTVLVLSRAEELVPGRRDAWERFPAAESVLERSGVLGRPIVDEYAVGLRGALRALMPGWVPRKHRPRVHLSHDLDEVGVPFRLRQTVGHAVRRGSFAAALRDLAASALPVLPAFLQALHDLVSASRQHGLRAAVYLKASPRTRFDSGYALEHPRLRESVHRLRDHGVELGIHPSHFTLGEPARLAEEVSALRNFLGAGPLGGRQHHLRWSPESWLDWERAGLAYDGSVGFADQAGFRAGTCFPYRPWLFWLDREADLVELPLVAMDTTLIRYRGLSPEAMADALLRLLAQCRSVGGVFTLLWHNTNFVQPEHVRLYRQLLAELAPLEPFDAREIDS
jgi:hypothetical protein